MVQLVHFHAESAVVSVRARLRRFRLAGGTGPCTPRPPVGVTDEQILAFVAAAEALSRRQRRSDPGISDADAEERLLCLDWAVRAGRLALAERGPRP